MKFSLKNLLFSSWFLYFIVFVVFFNLIGHALNGNFMVILLFILVSFITSFFSKNMIVILVIGITVANILVLQKNGYVEGMSASRNKFVDDDDAEDALKDDSKIDDVSAKDFSLTKTSNETLQKKMDDIKKAKEAIEKMKGRLPSDPDKIKMNEKEGEFVKTKFTDLLKIQEDILSNIGNLEKSMMKVDSIVEDVKSNIEGVRKSMAAKPASSSTIE